MSSLFINKVQNEMKSYIDSNSTSFQAAEAKEKNLDDKYNLSTVVKRQEDKESPK